MYVSPIYHLDLYTNKELRQDVIYAFFDGSLIIHTKKREESIKKYEQLLSFLRILLTKDRMKIFDDFALNSSNKPHNYPSNKDASVDITKDTVINIVNGSTTDVSFTSLSTFKFTPTFRSIIPYTHTPTTNIDIKIRGTASTILKKDARASLPPHPIHHLPTSSTPILNKNKQNSTSKNFYILHQYT